MTLAQKIVKLLDNENDWEEEGNYLWAHSSGLLLSFSFLVTEENEKYTFGWIDSWRLCRAFRKMLKRKESSRLDVLGLGPTKDIPARILDMLATPSDWEMEDLSGEWTHKPTGLNIWSSKRGDGIIVRITKPKSMGCCTIPGIKHDIQGVAANRIHYTLQYMEEDQKRSRLEEMIERAEQKSK